jgi:hypothetical protein
MELLSDVRLYLVQEPGPSCFIVRCEGGDAAPSAVPTIDPRDDDSIDVRAAVMSADPELTLAQVPGMYRVTIGDVQGCTCGQEDTCVHVLFVMLRIMRLEPDNPLVWQRSLVDAEVDRLLEERELARLRALDNARLPAGGGKKKYAVHERCCQRAVYVPSCCDRLGHLWLCNCLQN